MGNDVSQPEGPRRFCEASSLVNSRRIDYYEQFFSFPDPVREKAPAIDLPAKLEILFRCFPDIPNVFEFIDTIIPSPDPESVVGCFPSFDANSTVIKQLTKFGNCGFKCLAASFSPTDFSVTEAIEALIRRDKFRSPSRR